MMRTCEAVLVVVSVVVFWGGAPAVAAPDPAEAGMTAAKLLDCYEKTQRQVYQSFVSRFEADIESYLNEHNVLEPGKRKTREVVETRSDGQRFYWCEGRSGQCFPTLKETTPAADPRTKQFLYDGRYTYNNNHEPLWLIQQSVRKYPATERARAVRSRLAVVIGKRFDPKSEFARRFGLDPWPDPAFLPEGLGTGGLSHQVGLAARLRQAHTLGLEPKLEPVGGAFCHVLRAALTETETDARGQKHPADHVYRIHFDPAHAYHIARLEQTATHRDRPGERPRSGPYLIVTQIVDQVRFQMVSGAWVPMEWQTCDSTCSWDGKFQQWARRKVRRTQMLLNPAHDTLGSFKPEFIKDGASVRLEGFSEGSDRKDNFIWKQGRVVDEAERLVIELAAKQPGT